MPLPGRVGERLERAERQLQALAAELADIRALAQAPPEVKATAEPEPTAPTLAAAWRALERGRALEALEQAEAVLAQGDPAAVKELEAFVDAARPTLGLQYYSRFAALRRDVSRPAPPTMKPPPSVAVAVPTQPPPAEPSRLRVWAERELTGARLFALGGGALMILGVVFLFVVAANRGWVGPAERVVLGATASLAAFAAGIVLRTRFGRLNAALAAVGVGIAGAYATLAAATIVYGLVPSWAALLVAAGIAAAGSALALAWSSEIVAGLALVGAAVAPGLVGLDEGVSAPGPAFALVVLAATVVSAAPRRWLWLLAAVGAAALAQVVWLVSESAAEDSGALAVAAAAAVLLLAAGAAWQSTATEEGLDPVAGTCALAGAGLVLGATRALLPAEQDAGLALAIAAVVYGIAAVGAARRWRDLGWVVGVASLMLAAVAIAQLLSGRSLSIALAISATALAGLAWRFGEPRFELASLGYLGLGIGHAVVVDLESAIEAGDVPSDAVPALFVLAGAALAVAFLVPASRTDAPSPGLLASLEPVWDELVRVRDPIRAVLAGLAVALAAAGSAGLLSGRWLTIVWCFAAAALGLAALALGERSILAAGLGVLGLAAVHAWTIEATPSTLLLDRSGDALTPVPSLVALGVAAVVVALACRVDARAAALRVVLLQAAAGCGVWAAGLVLVERSYEWGHVAATSLWAGFGLGFVALGASRRPGTEVAGWAILAFAFGKALLFDGSELAVTPASTSLLVVSGALLAAGFLTRWRKESGAADLELGALTVAAVAAVAAVYGLNRLLGDDQAFAAGLLGLALVLTSFAAAPFRRRGAGPAWARTLATGYWVLALLVLLLAETAATRYGEARTLTLWAATATALAAGWRWLDESLLWLAAAVVATVSTLGAIALVAPPDRLVDASAHPGNGLSTFVVCLLAALVVARMRPEAAVVRAGWLAGGAAAVGVYTVSLAVLELAERVSAASIETDFQRGHTALSALLGLAALGVYAVGLAREHRPLRVAGLTLFGLALAKLFLYDLSSLSSITRAFSFLALGAVLLAAAFFAERAVRGDRLATQ